ncbi:MAG: nitroreductase family protein [Alphaproteobacteria bacterium]
MDLSTVDHLLTTTRSVRKRLDFAAPVDPAVVQKCIEIAIQAPTGSNQQGWHFVVVTDAAKRRALADLYRRGWDLYASARVTLDATDPRAAQMPRIVASAEYLAKHLHEAPVMIVPCIEGRVEQAPQFAQASVYGSILPAVWSLMLALRARGLGSAWTTIHLMFEKEAAEVLGIPDHVTQSALLPVARFTGADFKPASRIPARDRTYWDTWGARR